MEERERAPKSEKGERELRRNGERESLMMVVAGLYGGVATVSRRNRRCATGNSPWGFAAALTVPSHRRCSLSSPEFIRLLKTKPCPSLDLSSGPFPLPGL
ncbi:hypothetical protein PIB30_091911 [Stylosanthes scabra]|uniref:Uncharacterized protein n=1 Tax=Stylosanthes scabra TaxID=79078 RepID=A0ABU6TUA8_9FABA|nr:hypothetical protein [Stylosanthes scabra]